MPAKPLDQKLFEEAYGFEFFQAVRLLERLFPERSAVGGEAMPSAEVVRFRSRIGLDFPSSEIHEINKSDDGTDAERIEMFVNFMGVVGVSGVMPTHYTELVMDRNRHRDTAMWAFLDIFTHRAVSLFYRAWMKYRFPVGYERGEDGFTGYLYDLIGLGTRGLRGRMAIRDEALLPYSGLIAQTPHSANAIENILSDQFQTTAKIDQFSGQWLELEERDITKLGRQNSRLGQSAIVGKRVWDQQSKFRVKLGPMELKKFQGFLPNGSAAAPMRSILDLVVGREFDFDVQLFIETKQVPATILTTRAIRRPQLGWTTWLKTKPFTAPDGQVILQSN